MNRGGFRMIAGECSLFIIFTSVTFVYDQSRLTDETLYQGKSGLKTRSSHPDYNLRTFEHNRALTLANTPQSSPFIINI